MTCALCGGPLTLLGRLGHYLITRCRDCGHTIHHEEES